MKGLAFLLCLLAGPVCAQPAQNTSPRVLGDPRAIIADLSVGQDAPLLAAVSDGNLELWDYGSGVRLQQWGHPSGFTAVAIRADGALLLAGSRDGEVRRFARGMQEGELIYRHDGGLVSSLEFCSPAGFAVAGFSDGAIAVIDPDVASAASSLKVLDAEVHALRADSACAQLYSAGADGRLRVHSLPDLQLLQEVRASRRDLRDLSLSRDGKRLLTAGDDRVLRYWSIDGAAGFAEYNQVRGGHWILSCDMHREADASVMADLLGHIEVRIPFGRYSAGIGVPVNCIRFVDPASDRLLMVAGTHGKGLQLIDALHMRFKNKKAR
jgi:WD40 repeat protein